MDISPDKQNIDNVFSNTTYYIDFYQRQYKWNEEPVKRLEEIEGFKKSEHYDWGNFISFRTKAGETMMTNKIKAQTKRHWNKLNRLLK